MFSLVEFFERFANKKNLCDRRLFDVVVIRKGLIMSRALLFRALCVLVTHPSGDASRILAEVTLPESNFYPSD